jgi:HAD superfamily hydrolase (TIGR01509 family)
MSPPVRAVCFDVGETLICEQRVWTDWARWLGVPTTTFLAELGAVIERRQHHLRVFDAFRDPHSFDVQAERTALLAAGRKVDFDSSDLYPDALPCLRALKDAGLKVAVCGNQPPAVSEDLFSSCGVELDLIASSAAWGVEKPSAAFFDRLVAELGVLASEIAYVGDRVDNDVLPANAAGMTSVFIRRGPWGFIHADWPEVHAATLRIESLDELPRALGLA